MRLFLTEYQKEGKSYGGPLIIASDWEEAERQAEDFNIIVVGEIHDFGETEFKPITKRVLH
tara:strand:- start:4340 stop:4522 length:183 start_codon:yes stop_codon:yes gene_type:complete